MADQYLRGVLTKYSAAPRVPQVNLAFASLHSILVPWAGNLLHSFHASGSFAKGTSIILGTDLDVFLCVSHMCTDNLRELYRKTRNRLAQTGFQPREQNVSLRVVCQGITCDVVPARKIPGYHHHASLYRRRANSWTLTDVNNHIRLIANSGRLEEIRIFKIWLALNRLDVPSFFTELLVLQALSTAPFSTLANNVIKTLEFIKTRGRIVRLIDPSNTNNIVSDDVTVQERTQLVSMATQALSGTWAQFVW